MVLNCKLFSLINFVVEYTNCETVKYHIYLQCAVPYCKMRNISHQQYLVR